MLAEARSDDRIVGLPISFKRVAPDNCKIRECPYSPNIPNKSLEETWNAELLAVRSICETRPSHGQATMLLLMKFPVVGVAVLLNHNVKRDANRFHCDSYLGRESSHEVYAFLTLYCRQAEIGLQASE